MKFAGRVSCRAHGELERDEAPPGGVKEGGGIRHDRPAVREDTFEGVYALELRWGMRKSRLCLRRFGTLAEEQRGQNRK